MRFAVGAMLFEGNTFSPVIARRADFASKYLVHGDAVVATLKGTGTEIGGAIDEAMDGGDSLLPPLATHGGAGGTVASDFTRELADSMLERLRRLTGIDGIFVALHGAFVSQDSLNVDGDLLARVRAAFPNTPIVVSCDLHAYVTDRMLAHCDALTGYRHYPHDDTYETGRRALAMLREFCDGRLVPALVRCRIPLLAAAQNQRTRGSGPMSEIRALADKLMTGAVRDVAHFCVQPWIDAPALGFTAVVTADRDTQAGLPAAEELGRAMWARRERYLVTTLPPARAIAAGLAIDGLVVLADASDCVGGGASGDSAATLAALLEHAPTAVAAIHIADDVAARAALAAGVGARLHIAIGNRRDPAYGAPLQVDAEVVRLPPDGFVYCGGLMRGVRAETGPAAVLRIGAVEALVTANACYEYADEAFRAAGINTRTRKFVVVKNPIRRRALRSRQLQGARSALCTVARPGPKRSAERCRLHRHCRHLRQPQPRPRLGRAAARRRVAHLFVAAGNGTLAAASCARFWQLRGAGRPALLSVEPTRSDCLRQSIAADAAVTLGDAGESVMDGLVVGTPSRVAWPILRAGIDAALAIPDATALETLRELAAGAHGDAPLEIGETGIASIAAGRNPKLRAALAITRESRLIAIACEGVTDRTVFDRLVGAALGRSA